MNHRQRLGPLLLLLPVNLLGMHTFLKSTTSLFAFDVAQTVLLNGAATCLKGHCTDCTVHFAYERVGALQDKKKHITWLGFGACSMFHNSLESFTFCPHHPLRQRSRRRMVALGIDRRRCHG